MAGVGVLEEEVLPEAVSAAAAAGAGKSEEMLKQIQHDKKSLRFVSVIPNLFRDPDFGVGQFRF